MENLRDVIGGMNTAYIDGCVYIGSYRQDRMDFLVLESKNEKRTSMLDRERVVRSLGRAVGPTTFNLF
jgi:hypothetical protein